MKRRIKKWLTVFLVIFAALFLTASLLLHYVNNSFVPGHLKNFISHAIYKNTHCRADIGSLRLGLKDGFILDGVKIYMPITEELLLSAERVCFNIVFIPSFSGQKIIIPVLRIYSSHINMRRQAEPKWDFTSILQIPEAGKKPLSFSIRLNNIIFEDGNIDFSDQLAIKNFKKQLTGLKGSIGMGNTLTFKAGGRADECDFYVSGKYQTDDGKLIFECEAENLDPQDIAAAYIDSAVCDIKKADMSGHAKGSVFKGRLSLTECDIFAENVDAVVNGVRIIGCYNLRGKTAFDMDSISNIEYAFGANINNGRLGIEGDTLLDNISGIKADIEFTNTIWRVKELSCLFYGFKAQIYGLVKNPMENYTITSNLKTQINLKDIAGKNNIPVNSGTACIDLDIACDKTGFFNVKGKSDIKDLAITGNDFYLSGNFSLTGQGSGVLDNWRSAEYKGTVTFDNTHVSGAGGLPSIYNAAGEAQFTDRSISIKKLNGTISDTNISLSGNIAYKDTAVANLRLETGPVPLPRLISLLPDSALKKFEGVELSGNCSLDIRFKGIISNPDSHSYEGHLIIDKGSAVLGVWPYRISDISSNISFKGRDISWRGMDFTVYDKRYSCSGRIPDCARPSVAALISSEDLSLDLETGPLDENRVLFSKLNGKYQGLTFSLKGAIDVPSNPRVNFSGQAYLDLKDLPETAKHFNSLIKDADMEGVAKFNIDAKGPLARPIDWTVFIEGTSGNLRINDFILKDVYLDYRMQDRFVDIPVLSLSTYDGIVNASCRANLKTDEKPFIVNLDIKDIDLHKFAVQAKGVDKRIKGLLSSKTVLNGYINNRDCLKGNGWLQVANGYLWEFPVLRGIMNILLMEPPEYIILTDAFGNFVIEKDRIYTGDFKMLSKSASLLWEGGIGFDRSLDFNITGRFAESVIKQVSEPGRIKNAMLREAGSLIMEVHLTGTLEHPNYQIVPFPLQRIFHDKITNTINDIFGNIQE
ncbi:MAG: hypothetical protein PHV77_03750 [Candidatus Omnitrophica bacterium]|nr:hypothetical protein [Candidatus Omnitrophota bacterium]